MSEIEYALKLMQRHGDISDALRELFEYIPESSEEEILAKVIKLMRSYKEKL